MNKLSYFYPQKGIFNLLKKPGYTPSCKKFEAIPPPVDLELGHHLLILYNATISVEQFNLIFVFNRLKILIIIENFNVIIEIEEYFL